MYAFMSHRSIYIYTSIFICVCVTYVLYICIYIYITYKCMYVCMYLCMYVCMFVCMYVCVYIYSRIYIYTVGLPMYITYISQHFAAFRVSCGEAVSCPVRSLRRCLDSSARSWLRKGNGSVDTSESWSTIFLRRCGTRRWRKLETKKKASVVSPIAATFYFYKSFWSVLRSQALEKPQLDFRQ